MPGFPFELFKTEYCRVGFQPFEKPRSPPLFHCFTACLIVDLMSVRSLLLEINSKSSLMIAKTRCGDLPLDEINHVLDCGITMRTSWQCSTRGYCLVVVALMLLFRPCKVLFPKIFLMSSISVSAGRTD